MTYLVFVWSPSGYTLQERDGEPPKVGEEPLPGDQRPCVFSDG